MHIGSLGHCIFCFTDNSNSLLGELPVCVCAAFALLQFPDTQSITLFTIETIALFTQSTTLLSGVLCVWCLCIGCNWILYHFLLM
jgi:hypothetical protein